MTLRRRARTLRRQTDPGVATISATFSADDHAVTYRSDKALSHYTVMLCSGRRIHVESVRGEHTNFLLGPYDERISWVNLKAGRDRVGSTFHGPTLCGRWTSGGGGWWGGTGGGGGGETASTCQADTPVRVQAINTWNIELTSCSDRALRIYYDPWVSTRLGSHYSVYTIGYGFGEVVLSDGARVTWDTDPSNWNAIHYLRVERGGRAWTTVANPFALWGGTTRSAATTMTDTQLWEFAAALRRCAGDVYAPLTCTGAGTPYQQGAHLAAPTEAAAHEPFTVRVSHRFATRQRLYTFAQPSATTCAHTAAANESRAATQLLDSTSLAAGTATRPLVVRTAGMTRLCAYLASSFDAIPASVESAKLDVARPLSMTVSDATVVGSEAARVRVTGHSSGGWLRLFAVPGSAACAETGWQMAGAGATPVWPATSTSSVAGDISFDATFAPRSAGTYRYCGYLSTMMGSEHVASDLGTVTVQQVTVAAKVVMPELVVGRYATVAVSGTASHRRILQLMLTTRTSCATTVRAAYDAGATYVTAAWIGAGSFSLAGGFTPMQAGTHRICGYVTSDYYGGDPGNVVVTAAASAREPIAQAVVAASGASIFAGELVAVSITGSTEVPATLRAYATPEPSTCAASSDLQSQVDDALALDVTGYGSLHARSLASGDFAVTARLAPPASGTYRLCAYLGSTGSTQRVATSAATYDVEQVVATMAATVATSDPLAGQGIGVRLSGTTSHAATSYVFTLASGVACPASIDAAQRLRYPWASGRLDVAASSFDRTATITPRAGSYELCAYLGNATGSVTYASAAAVALAVREPVRELRVDVVSTSAPAGDGPRVRMSGTSEVEGWIMTWAMPVDSSCATSPYANAQPAGAVSMRLDDSWGSSYRWVGPGDYSYEMRAPIDTSGEWRFCAHLSTGSSPLVTTSTTATITIEPVVVTAELGVGSVDPVAGRLLAITVSGTASHARSGRILLAHGQVTCPASYDGTWSLYGPRGSFAVPAGTYSSTIDFWSLEAGHYTACAYVTNQSTTLVHAAAMAAVHVREPRFTASLDAPAELLAGATGTVRVDTGVDTSRWLWLFASEADCAPTVAEQAALAGTLTLVSALSLADTQATSRPLQLARVGTTHLCAYVSASSSGAPDAVARAAVLVREPTVTAAVTAQASVDGREAQVAVTGDAEVVHDVRAFAILDDGGSCAATAVLQAARAGVVALVSDTGTTSRLVSGSYRAAFTHASNKRGTWLVCAYATRAGVTAPGAAVHATVTLARSR